MSEKKPFEIARETLKQLTTKKLVPTPANYQALYNEIAGIPATAPFPAETLREIAKALPVRTPGQQKQKSLLEYAIDRLNWEGVKSALVAYGGFVPANADEPTAGVSKPAAVSIPALTSEFFGQLGRMIEYTQPALGTDDARFAELTTALTQALRQSGTDVIAVKSLISTYSDRVSFVAEDQAEIKKTLLKLLHLVFENIAELSIEEQWLKGQMEALMAAATPPLTLRRLDDVERRLKDVIFKQKDAKERTLQAQSEMRQMLAAFIERLSDMAKSTGTFQSKLEENARQIEQAKTLEEIAKASGRTIRRCRRWSAPAPTIRWATTPCISAGRAT